MRGCPCRAAGHRHAIENVEVRVHSRHSAEAWSQGTYVSVVIHFGRARAVLEVGLVHIEVVDQDPFPGATHQDWTVVCESLLAQPAKPLCKAQPKMFA